MSRTPRVGLAMLCNDDGVIIKMIDDRLALSRPLVVGDHLTELLAGVSSPRLDGFLAEIRESGTAYDCGVEVDAPSGPIALRLAGSRTSEGILVIAAVSFDEVVSLVKDFMGMNNELVNTVRALSKELSQARSQPGDESEELLTLRAELEDARATQSEFLAGMSHELRTPLNSIIGFSDLMRNGMVGEVSDEQRRQLDMISNAGRYLLGLVSDILEMSSLSTPPEEEYTVFEAAWVASEALEMLRLDAAEKGLTLSVKDPRVPVLLRSDRDSVRHVLVRLIGNSIRFTRQGDVALGWSQHGDWVRFEVADTGPGIPVERRGAIFQEFQQLEVPGTAKSTGAGLGLPISRRLVEQLGGRIFVDSGAQGVGSIFWFEIPANRP